MSNVNYCLSCGGKLETRNIGGEDRRACPDCSFVHWGSYSIGVGACVVKEDKVLLVRRAQQPGKGLWTTPGGYTEQLELINNTIEREVLEEAGVQAAARQIIAIRDRPHAVHDVYICFAMDYIDGDPQPDQVEVDGAGFFSLEEMQAMEVAELSKWLVEIALNSGTGGLAVDENPSESLSKYGLFRSL